MSKKILFSPIGSTDPISNNKDGSMLHICRVYKPDVVYLYLSKEMLDLHIQDNRYCFCIEQLGKLINHKFDIKIIERPDLIDVQKLDDFYQDFGLITKQILEEQGEDSQIYVNVSSGTPAMKYTLQLLSAISPSIYIPIQVDTPTKGLNPKREDVKNYNRDSQWEMDLDNNSIFTRRCNPSNTNNLFVILLKENICKHLLAYDYAAAFTLLTIIQDKVSQEAIDLIKAAYHRSQLNENALQNLLGIKESGITLNHVLPQNKKLIEYILWLQIKQKRRDYADFIRGLTPISADLFEYCLLNNCGIDITTICEASTRDGITKYRLTAKKLAIVNPDILKLLNESYKKGYRDSDLGSSQMLMIVNKYCEDQELKSDLYHLRKVEEKVRNIAAHEIVSVTEDWIKAKTTFSSNDLIQMIGRIAKKVGADFEDRYWNSYDQMNELIISKLKEY